ncbi:hypothetical protein P4U99_03405 [Brevibacillus agri]|uniref:phage tail assembly chaperone G n=1 Tax=Brevibacillus agri TaxID=51101 RepID=UPI002E240AF0|nr:hypothetical protein [Brevibacillus agri]MED1652602.1 hypothetical protein [Brevibacillus agri]MED1689644.1 hypothetical protein [Brevibacillus agri]MED1691118.1 hypothetical protein [Brevibacillus agri]MED1696772.1 hypothetical protein [Brevibacillus agri]
MQITLRINGEEKTFTQDFISARMFRRAIEMQKHFKSGSDMDENTLDEMVGFVAEAYGKQFTSDEFYDGIESAKLIPTITQTINTVVGRSAKALGTDSNDPNQAPAQ